ncbi:MAG: hypothetical protein AMXMBFR64_05430 [Myxococcales bacterium]
MRTWWMVLALVPLLACSEDGVRGATGDGDAGANVVTDTADAAESGDLGVLPTPDGGTKPDVTPDTAGRTPLAGTGEPCVTNQDCESGWCLNGPDESICTETCLETCPAAYVCKSVINLPPDVVYLCVPTRWDLCKPCGSDAECGGPADQCVPTAEGQRCGTTCTTGADCPDGYSCEAGQCRPSTGSCECFAGRSGQSEPCSSESEHGTCAGTRTCAGATGWTECSAKTPAPEACNGKDDDCDGATDEQDASGCLVWHMDGDGDGAGGTETRCLCAPQPPWTATQGGDCDDANPAAHPAGAEVCGGGDEDCDGEVDEAGAGGCVPYFRDDDGDTFGAGDPLCLCAASAPHTALQAGDCDDGDPDVKPTAPESCNGKDDDCDGQTDESGAIGCEARFLDEDGDGWGTTAACVCDGGTHTALAGGDCDDGDDAIHPGATETCNTVDDDCDGVVDGPGAGGCELLYQDADGDGAGVTSSAACLCGPEGTHTATTGGDCDDGDEAVHPGAAETCEPGDEDCDGQVNEAGAVGCADRFPDADGDGFGATASVVCLCAPTVALPVSVGGDCDDEDAAVNPFAQELCWGGDEDCDGEVNEPGAFGCQPYWKDADGDGYGEVGQSQCLCTPDGDWTATAGGDCDDGDPTVLPGVVELCDEAADCCAATACVYGVCVSPSPCADTDGCSNDTTCDGGQCVPWGIGPLPSWDAGCAKPTIVGQFHPALQCEWTAPPEGDPYPSSITVIATPTVVDLDLDDDPSTVHPSIVIPTGEAGCDQPNSFGAGVIRILDGRTCEQLHVIGEPRVVAAATLALGDLDGDGRPEIVALKEGGGLVAFRWGGAAWGVHWTSTKAGQPDTVPTTGVRYGGPTLADVDGDGVPEVLQGAILYNNAGVVIADNLGLKSVANGPLSVVADVDGDGHRELVRGDGVWQFNGSAWVKEPWSGGGTDGFVALADFGTWAVPGLTEPLPEVVVVSQGTVRIQTLAGQVVYGPYDLPFFPPAPTKGTGGPPTVGDFDGDGSPEVALAGRGSYTVFDPGCAGSPPPFGCWGDGILWSVPSQDYSSSVTGSSVFDFEADGLAEAVYADECFVRVYSGLTGEILFSQARSSGTWYENPIVADVDGDFRSEVVVGSNTNCNVTCPSVDPYFRGLRCQTSADCGAGATCKVGYCRCTDDASCGAGFACMAPLPNTPGKDNVCRASHPGKFDALRVFGDVGDNWATSRTVWNQHMYFVTNVDEDGTLPPAGSPENWQVPGLNNFMQNVQGDLDPTAAPDLTAQPLLLGNCGPGSSLLVSAAVCNRGAAPVDAGVPVAFYDGAPEASGAIACLLATAAVLHPGDCEKLTCPMLIKGGQPHTIHVIADFGAESKECHEGNNRAVFEGVTCLNLP